MKFREYRSLIEESMKTVVEIKPTRQALYAAIEKTFTPETKQYLPKMEDIIIKSYGMDMRIEWDTFIVLAPDKGVLGFTDGPIKD